MYVRFWTHQSTAVSKRSSLSLVYCKGIMAGVVETSTTGLARCRKSVERMTYAEKAEQNDLPLSTYWHRLHGRPSRKETATKSQYLTTSEEKALIDYVLRVAARGYPVPVKFLRYLA